MKLEDSAFDASSYKSSYAPHMGRLNSITGNGRLGGWQANVNNVHQWFKVRTVLFFIPCLKKYSQSEAWVVSNGKYSTRLSPPLLASDYQNGAKTVCVPFRNGVKVVG